MRSDIEKLVMDIGGAAQLWYQANYERGEITPAAWITQYTEQTSALFEKMCNEVAISELSKLKPPIAEMIPQWEWPCYICGFDRELLSKHIEDRITALKTKLGK